MPAETPEIRLLSRHEAHDLDRIAPEVFDKPVVARLRDEFFADSRHHMVVALEAGVVVGFASGVHYVHPDKPPELWIGEIAVTPALHRQGVARRLLAALVEHARALGCVEAWVLTEPYNHAALALYASAGMSRTPADPVMFTLALAP
jgi:GNAT superfamily N-acetyltransferase